MGKGSGPLTEGLLALGRIDLTSDTGVTERLRKRWSYYDAGAQIFIYFAERWCFEKCM